MATTRWIEARRGVLTVTPVLFMVAFMAALMAALLSACTTQQEGRLLVAPGGYELYNCQQLAVQVTAQRKREAELLQLIAKAKQGPAGNVVSAISYEPDLAIARAELRKLHAEQVNQKCPATPPANSRNLPTR